MFRNLLILIAVISSGYFAYRVWRKRVKIPSNDKLTEAEKQGLITHEEFLRLKYDRAKEIYERFLKKEKK